MAHANRDCKNASHETKKRVDGVMLFLQTNFASQKRKKQNDAENAVRRLRRDSIVAVRSTSERHDLRMRASWCHSVMQKRVWHGLVLRLVLCIGRT